MPLPKPNEALFQIFQRLVLFSLSMTPLYNIEAPNTQFVKVSTRRGRQGGVFSNFGLRILDLGQGMIIT